jgi:hypothetical protein
MCACEGGDFLNSLLLDETAKKRFGCKTYLELKQNNFLISNSSNRKNSLSE